MGCGASTNNSEEDTIERKRNQRIEARAKAAQKKNEAKIKMLLLGAGESGKSTIFKQMRILYGAPRTEDEIRMFGVVVRSNVVVVVKKLLTLINDMDLEDTLVQESEETSRIDGESGMSYKEAYDELKEAFIDNPDESSIHTEEPSTDWVGYSNRAGSNANKEAKKFLKYQFCLKTLWESKAAKEAWKNGAKVNINASHMLFLNDSDRLASPTYKPTNEDILLARVRTTQVIVERYMMGDSMFEVTDVGGQRAERRKWIGCFDNVDGLIFVAALSEYDQTLAEAKRQNRMKEALDLFKFNANDNVFSRSGILLFLNKSDLFEEKILTSHIADQKHFSDYVGPDRDYHAGIEYFKKKFSECVGENSGKDIYIHVTCATDTNAMEAVLGAARLMIIKQNLANAGL